MPYRGGDRLEDLFAKSGRRKDDEHNAFEQGEHHAVRIRETASARDEDQRKYDKRIDAHARSLRQRHLCKERHEHGSRNRADRRRDIRRAVRILSADYEREKSRVYHKDVNHRHERRKTGDHFRLKPRTALRDAEVVVHFSEKSLMRTYGRCGVSRSGLRILNRIVRLRGGFGFEDFFVLFFHTSPLWFF